MLILVVSDFHLGPGEFNEDGSRNTFEDFLDDDLFLEFTNYYSSGVYEEDEVHLVLNGDIFNLIQIPIDGELSHIIDEERTIKALDIIADGHPQFFQALKDFSAIDKKYLHFTIGNHDAGLDFKGVKQRLRDIVQNKAISIERRLHLHGVHIEHGHRFEAINTVPPLKYYQKGPEGKKILNLPWGSLFCIQILPEIKRERPHIDKIRPIPKYIKWTLFHDLSFFLWLAYKVVGYLVKTSFGKYTRQNSNFKTTFKMLKQVTIYPKYEKQAWRILNKKRYQAHTVVMGHTHLAEYRKFKSGQLYFNSGTWNPIPSIDAAHYKSISQRSYVSIRLDKEKSQVRNAYLNFWNGKWRPFKEWVSLDQS